MSGIYRTIKCRMWHDSWIDTLDPAAKLYWTWLLTNEKTEPSGLYEMKPGTGAFELGLAQETVRKYRNMFERDGKAYFDGAWVLIPGFIEHQPNRNPNVWVSMAEQIRKAPEQIQGRWFDANEEILATLENRSGDVYENALSILREASESLSKAFRNGWGDRESTVQREYSTDKPRAREPLFGNPDGPPDGIDLPTAVGRFVYGKNGKDGNGGVSENARTEFFGLLRDTAELWGKDPVNRALGELKVGLPDNPEAIARYMKPILVKQVKIERQRILDQREFEERRKRHTKELPDENKAKRLLHRLEGKTDEDDEDAGAA